MPLYPGANQSYRYDEKYPSSYTGGPFKGLLHSTETTVRPGYQGGASAPHFTLLPLVSKRQAIVYQHYDTSRPSRALVNLPGGVQTGRDSVIQIELVGTCDKKYRDKYGGVYWPEAPKWLLDELAKLMRWIETTHGVKRESTKRPWVPYPKSYANGGGQRMTNAEWDTFGGWCGHQHAPENTHGDPGDIDINYLLGVPTTDPTRPRLGDRGEIVATVQALLVRWGYELDRDGVFGPATDAAVRSFQRQHALDVDGIVGPATMAALNKPKPPPVDPPTPTKEIEDMNSDELRALVREEVEKVVWSERTARTVATTYPVVLDPRNAFGPRVTLSNLTEHAADILHGDDGKPIPDGKGGHVRVSDVRHIEDVDQMTENQEAK